MAGEGRASAITEILVDHPRMGRERIQLSHGRLLIACNDAPAGGRGPRPNGAGLSPSAQLPTRTHRLTPSSCCPPNSRLSLTRWPTGITVLNVGQGTWRHQAWGEPLALDRYIRRSQAPPSGDQRVSADPLQSNRLVTIWLGAAESCWRLGLINPSAVLTSSALHDRGTVSGERPCTLTPDQRRAVHAKYGAYLSFPADPEPQLWAPDLALAGRVSLPRPEHERHLATLRDVAVDHGFPVAREGDDPHGLGLLYFLLRTGSISYEQLVEDTGDEQHFPPVKLP
ncbi:hypothetical protein FAIPA1_350001 [Frankia sp. AiPs1]